MGENPSLLALKDFKSIVFCRNGSRKNEPSDMLDKIYSLSWFSDPSDVAISYIYTIFCAEISIKLWNSCIMQWKLRILYSYW